MRAREEYAIEDSDLKVRLASVPAGIGLTVVVCGAALVDALFYSAPQNRLVLVALLAGAVGFTLLGGLLPWDRIIAGRWRERAFLTWSLSDVAIIAAFTLVDGKPNSPMSLMFLVPMIFVAMTYPMRSVVTVGIAAISAYVATAMAVNTDTGTVILFSAMLVSTAGMGAWQARNHDRVRDELARASRTDPLTGCLNRRGFQDRAEAAIRHAAQAGASLAVLVVDLDGFKQINDTGGHAAGDAVLTAVADALLTFGRGRDLVGRLGGDEFAILVHDVDAHAAEAAAARLEAALSGVARASIGVGAFPSQASTLDELITRADRFLYVAKRAKGSQPAAAA